MTARDLARRAFWSDHPLTALYSIAHGRWDGARFVPAESWSLRQLIAFAEPLPAPIVSRMAGEGA